jgi:hypothetical protein
MTIIDLSTLYKEPAKLSAMRDYIEQTLKLAGDGKKVIITGKAPVWLYLSVAHALHGKVKRLIYRSPVSGDVQIFDHNPF